MVGAQEWFPFAEPVLMPMNEELTGHPWLRLKT